MGDQQSGYQPTAGKDPGPPPTGGSAVQPPRTAAPTSQGTSHSAEIDKIALALAKAQGAMKPAEMTGWNPHFEKPYASLADCWDAARESLAKNELAIIQLTGNTGNLVTVTTILTHSSGQWFKSVLALQPAKSDPQGLGSAITYGRRYGFNAMVGIAQDEGDDDGNAASGKSSGNPPSGGQPARPIPPKANTTSSATGSSARTGSKGTSARAAPATGASARPSRAAIQPRAEASSEEDVPDFQTGLAPEEDRMDQAGDAGIPVETRAQLNKRLMPLWGPFFKMHPKVKPIDVLVEQFGVDEAAQLTDDQVRELIEYLTQMAGGAR